MAEASATGDSLVQPGEILAGKYQVERVLGAGGMGVVVAAHHIQLDEKVALKFLLPAALGDAEALARFEREARAAVKIKSEHVARISDVGKLENGAPYIVMEYLEGRDLAGMLEATGKLPAEQAADFLLQTCEAIAEAHSFGIVHRDLKPSNLFCIRRRDGQLSIKVLDFGISKVISGAGGGSGDLAMTKTTAVVGSPVYMSPEQLQSSRGVDHRTDVWSMGVILYELLTGRVPFDASTVTELAIIIATQPTPPMGAVPGLPPGLEAVVMRCLEKARERRFQNVGEVADALAPFASARSRPLLERIHGLVQFGKTASSPGAVTGPTGGPALVPRAGAQSGSTVAGWQADTASKKGGKAIVGVAAAAVVVLAAAGAAMMLRKSPSAQPGTVSAAALAAPSGSASPTPPAASSPVSTSGSASPDDALPVASPPASTATPSAAVATPALHPTVRARPVPATTPAAAAGKAHCTPPYYFDAQGNRVFKKECL